MSRGLLLALLGVVLLASTGCEDTTVIQQISENPVDQELRSALSVAGVHGVTAPQPENTERVELGRFLFFDKILSGNRNISCATCHHPAAATGDALPVPIGEGGIGLAEARSMGTARLIPRNAPHIFNSGVNGVNSMFWDSRVRFDPMTRSLQTPEPGLNGTTPTLADLAAPLNSALAAQAMFPVTSFDEMRGLEKSNEIADAEDNAAVWSALMARLGNVDEYRALFLAAYPDASTFEELNFGHAARAIAAFERQAWLALDTPFDRYVAGDESALSQQEKRGALLFFGDAGCSACHSGPLLSDFEHHALAVPQVGPGKNAPGEDLGLALQTQDPADNYRFRTPTLRNVALTGPWMHDGCYTTLEGAVRHHLDCVNSLLNYDESQLPALFRETVDSDAGRIQRRLDALQSELLQPLNLSETEVDDLLAFLHALTDPRSLNLAADIPARVPSGLPVAD